MIKIPLTIRYAEEPRRPPVAWLMRDNDPAAWLAEWSRWELPMADWRIVPIDGVGVLTIVADGQIPRHSPLGIPLWRVGDRIYLPTHADLAVAAEPVELESLLASEIALAILLPEHPAIAVAAHQVLSVGDLLSAPTPRPSDWGCAQGGEAQNERLHAVLPELLPSLDDFLDEGRGDIGKQSQDLHNLPPRPGEPGEGLLDKARRGLGKAAADMARFVAGLSSAGGAAGQGRPGNHGSMTAGGAGGGLWGWFQSLANWANQAAGSISRELEELRNKEVLRLLHMLQNNPDEGLKYAPPFGGGAHRGLAPPGGRLLPRNVDFSLGSLGGGGPADFWSLPHQYQEQLRRRYRELANRELGLRRYRRAAYIFAELLGELDSAAAALQSGGHYREAATLYSERLNKMLAAAQCLEQGGFLTEAIAIFEQLGHDEKIGDLYARLAQPEEAEGAWRRAIEVAIVQRDDYLDAARVAEKKLKRDDEALAILDRGWMQSRQAAACLARHFGLLGERGRHDDAKRRLGEFRRAGRDAIHDLMIAETLSAQVATYPDAEFCSRAADIVRTLAGAHLRAALQQERQRYVAAVSQLAPGDKLLERDGQRYLTQHVLPRPPRSVAKPRGLPQPQRICAFPLPARVAWKVAVAQGEVFFAAGIADGKLELVRGRWMGQLQSAQAKGRFFKVSDVASVLLAADLQGRGPLLVASSHGEVEGSWQFSPTDQFPQLAVGLTPNGNLEVPMGCCYAHGLAYQLDDRRPCLAFGYAVESPQRLGQLVRTLDIGYRPDEVEEFLPTYGRPDLLAVGIDRHLHLFADTAKAEIFELPEPIFHLAGSAPFSRLRIAAGLAHGGSFLWAAAGHRIEDPPRRFAEDLISPHVCFTATGLLVALSENGGEIYSTTEGKLALKGRMPPLGQRPLAVLPTDFGNQFAILLPSGTMEVMELSS